jgi:nucleotide-binding universal stress UspA family protein
MSARGVQYQHVAKQNAKRRGKTRLRTIMVPMDFSVPAKKAFCYALNMARQFRARIILLHVVAPLESEDTAAAVRAARKELARLCNSARDLAKRCRSLVRAGIPFFEITQSADENAVELIILGRRDSAIVGKFGEGHTSDRVMRSARCPVLIVGESGRDFVGWPNGGTTVSMVACGNDPDA